VIQTVREKFSCRQCETITQSPAPFHVTPRGFAGPDLLAMILFEKFGQHQPLNRQSERYAREGIDMEPVSRTQSPRHGSLARGPDQQDSRGGGHQWPAGPSRPHTR
jgi:transposase